MKKLLSTIFLITIIITSYSQGYQISDKTSGFDLLNIDGKVVSDTDYAKVKGFIVIFTCNHCPFSIAYEDRIIALDKKYKKKGYPVIAINSNDSTIAPTDSYSNMQIRAEEKGFTFPYLLDADQSVAKAYGATRTPHVFILQRDKSDLIVRYIGAIDDNYEEPDNVKVKFVENAIDALLTNEAPNPDFTKAIGCTIKFPK